MHSSLDMVSWLTQIASLKYEPDADCVVSVDTPSPALGVLVGVTVDMDGFCGASA